MMTAREQRELYAPQRGDALTDRERQVIRLVAEGLANARVAVRLGLTEHTIKSRLRRACVKTGARDRTHLVALAYESGEIELGTVTPRA